MTNIELAKKILKVLNLQTENLVDLYDEFRKEFSNDFIWYPLYLASTWDNDLQSWCEHIIEGKSEKEFFGDFEEKFGIDELKFKNHE